jgi:hypothetical protein
METLLLVMPPAWLVRVAVAGVWVYEGLWCRILGRATSEFPVVEAAPRHGARFGPPFLMAPGRVVRAAAPGALVVLRSFG